MTDLRELYQQVILDHTKKPRNFHEMANATHHAEGYNPLCGDRVTVYLLVDGDTITDVSFTGSGCAICTSSASLMTQSLVSKKIDEATQLFGTFRDLVMGNVEADQTIDELDRLAVFTGVREFPMRVKCATLPWHTMKEALTGGAATISTE